MTLTIDGWHINEINGYSSEYPVIEKDLNNGYSLAIYQAAEKDFRCGIWRSKDIPQKLLHTVYGATLISVIKPALKRVNYHVKQDMKCSGKTKR